MRGCRAPLTVDGANGTQPPAQLLETLHGQAELGVDQAILTIANQTDPGVLELFGREVIPAAREIAVAGR